jgi:hypothetical protein
MRCFYVLSELRMPDYTISPYGSTTTMISSPALYSSDAPLHHDFSGMLVGKLLQRSNTVLPVFFRAYKICGFLLSRPAATIEVLAAYEKLIRFPKPVPIDFHSPSTKNMRYVPSDILTPMPVCAVRWATCSSSSSCSVLERDVSSVGMASFWGSPLHEWRVHAMTQPFGRMCL